jgi:hypothetical protein
MKNEERILELLAETLQRIDRHSELIERQQDEIAVILAQIQKHQERLDRHGEGLGALRERTEAIHQSSLEQVKAYQSITELLMHHNRALAAKGIL